MIGLYALKYPYRKILKPLAQKMKHWNPDYLGYLATFVALGTGICYFAAPKIPFLLIISIFLTLFRMTLNTIDGVIAIERGNLRLKGEIVNALPDRYSDVFIFAGVVLSGLVSPFWGIAAFATVFLVSYTGMLGKAVGVDWRHEGPLGKVERLILVMIFSIPQYLELNNFISNVGGRSYFEWLAIVFVVLGQYTVYRRLTRQVRQCKRLDWFKYRKIEKKCVVVYDSLTGNSAKVAREIADALACELVPLRRATASPDGLNDANDASKPSVSNNANNTNNATPQKSNEIAPDVSLSVEETPPDWASFDLVVFVTPNQRKRPTPAFCALLDQAPSIAAFALAVSSGAPVWRWISAPKVKKYFAEKLGKKPIATFDVKGFHSKFKTYKNRPNAEDSIDAFLFGIRSYERIAGKWDY